MAKVGGGIRGFARSRGFRLRRISRGPDVKRGYRYAIYKGRANMRARTAKAAASLIRGASS